MAHLMRVPRVLGPVATVVLLLVAQGSLSTAALAQERSTRQQLGFWATGAAGLGVPYELGVAGTAAVRYRRLVLRGRYATAAEFLGDWNDDYGVLAGVVLTSSRRGQVTAGAGVGRMRGTRGCILCGSTDVPAVTGFLMDFEARWSLTRFFGLSTYTFADFNRTESFGGVGVGLFLGRL